MAERALILGVLGGMGPAATLEFLARLQAYTPVEREQDHIRVLADINPRGLEGGMGGATLAEMAGALRGAGAEVLAMPCNSAHAHADLIQRASGLPLIDMIDLGAEEARRSGAMRAGVLGAKPALRLYREYLAARAMGIVTLSAESQDAFMATLDEIKGGELDEPQQQAMQAYAAELVRGGAEVLIAGCTEVPLVLEPQDVRVELVDPGDLLARRAVAVCLGWEALPQLV
jgi:aspartate racemase